MAHAQEPGPEDSVALYRAGPWTLALVCCQADWGWKNQLYIFHIVAWFEKEPAFLAMLLHRVNLVPLGAIVCAIT